MAAGADACGDADPLGVFRPEAGTGVRSKDSSTGAPHSDGHSSERAPVEPLPSRGTRWPRVAILASLTVVAIAGAMFVALQSASAAKRGTVFVETEPAGAEVWVNGNTLGPTPARLFLPRGRWAIELRYQGSVRLVSLTVVPEEVLRLRVELMPGLSELTALSSEETYRAPLDTAGTAADADESAQRARPASDTPDAAPAVAPVPVFSEPLPPAELRPGWVEFVSPAVLQIFQMGRLLGTSDTPLPLSPGEHQLDLISDELGFRVRRGVTVIGGESALLNVELPEAILAIDAQPWAEVWVNGERVGETPIRDLSRRIGPYEVLFRHPTLGERRAQVLLRAGEPGQLNVDLSPTVGGDTP